MEENIRLPAGDTAIPGPIRMWGYQRGIADAIGDPLIERVTVIKSARVGYTTLLVGALANISLGRAGRSWRKPRYRSGCLWKKWPLSC
jgi:hypothetical protein